MYIKSSRFHTERGKIVRNDSRTSGMAQKKVLPDDLHRRGQHKPQIQIQLNKVSYLYYVMEKRSSPLLNMVRERVGGSIR